jgi:hypothetical protein
MANLDLSGLDELQRKLEKVQGTNDVSSDDLFTDEFVSANTHFASWNDLCETYGVENAEEDCATEKFSDFVREHSDFESFEEMSQAAGAEWIKRQLE